ncbi:F-box only protein 43 [Echinops telfairi]|uniref:F-box only protein 43 n=1 Tax=Echinops telfairi TaxID=9371 RepID=A0ABM0ZT75_ECHTE|nr:F-box only protein 43 [Echinops telfairi]
MLAETTGFLLVRALDRRLKQAHHRENLSAVIHDHRAMFKHALFGINPEGMTGTPNLSRPPQNRKQTVKMERHSVQSGPRKEADSPAVDFKYSSFRDSGPTSSLQDSGYSELLKSCRLDNADKEVWGEKEEGPTLIHEQPEAPRLTLTHPWESPAPTKRRVSRGQDMEKSPELCETPKIGGEKRLLRRRLTLSFALLEGDLEPRNSTLDSCVSHSVGKNIASRAAGLPRQERVGALVSSSLSAEETTRSSEKLRRSFSQQKTSTIDDCKGDCGLFEVDCISPIPGSSFQDSITGDFSDSSLSGHDENAYPELLGASGRATPSGPDEDLFVTPVGQLAAHMQFHARKRLPPATHVRGKASTPEDSGFNSLSLEKSEDSLSDPEGSFQELLQKHQGPLTAAGDTRRKSRRLARSRRLSTLREQGSPSELEEQQPSPPASQPRPAAAPASSQSPPGRATPGSEGLVLSFKDLSNTPALQLVHELILSSKRKRFQQSGVRGVLEERAAGKLAVLQCVLAGLIGKKMGVEKLDILTELKYRNLKHILAVVLDALTAESLCSVWRVSRNWREIVIQDKKANRRRKIHITQLKTDSEGAILSVEDAATRRHLLNRSALRSVQAQARTPGAQLEQAPALSPWGQVLTPVASASLAPQSSKQEEYLKVAQTLFIDEALKPCPRCLSPAKVQPYKKRGVCSRPACGFDFCVLCLCAYHGSEECRGGAVKPRSRKDTLPGSAQSKRNLKRL